MYLKRRKTAYIDTSSISAITAIGASFMYSNGGMEKAPSLNYYLELVQW